MKTIIAGGLVSVALVLSGCSSGEKKSGQSADPTPISVTLKAIAGALKPAVAQVDPRKHLTRTAIDASPVPVLFAELETRGAFATLSKVGENRDIVTWITADGIGLSFKQGVLVATRGLGPDLMAADVGDVVAVLRSGNGDALRIHDYLNGEDQIVRRSFYCSARTEGRENLNIFGLIIPTRHVVESCQNPDLTLVNHYWITSGNRIWQSRQWVGSGIGYVFTQQLSR